MEPRAGNRLVRLLQSHITVWIVAALLLETVIAGLVGLSVVNRNRGACDPPTLLLGTRKYTIQTVRPESDGSLKIPEDQPGTAFWVEGTNTNQIFGLSQSEDNQGLRDSLKKGTSATVTWSNCNSITYVLGDALPDAQDVSSLMDQAFFGITVLIAQPGGGKAGLAVRGEIQEEPINTTGTSNPSEPRPALRGEPAIQSTETAIPTPSEVKINISLLDPVPSSDPGTVIIGLSISNVGEQPITLRDYDISLKTEDGPEVFPSLVQPALPKEIMAGGNLTVTVAFPRPQAMTAVLRILNVTFDYYF